MTPDAFRELLERSGMTGRELARVLGVSPMWVSRRLSGKTAIRGIDAAVIRKALDVPPDVESAW